MYLGRVIGTVVSTSKNKQLIGMKLLIVEKIDPNLKGQGHTEVVVDSIGAGKGEVVIVCEGSSARHMFGEKSPIDASIIGIVDTVEVG